MDSNSRSASPREPSRPQHRPPSPPSPTAFDNRAYQHDEADQNHNDSFTSNGPQQNGHTKEPNGDTKALEAVNLELINLTPKNGNTKKKDAVELDMSTSNPYDEYFVPVNEHRKYMRGEKLYVTADKRGDKGGCKRPLCWTLLALVAAVIVALIVLAATGILFSNTPTTVEQYNSSVSSARSFGGLAHDHSDHDHDHDHGHDHHDHDHHDHDHGAQTTEDGPQTQSDEARGFAPDDISDPSMYVPRTVEGELKIDNEVFTSDLQDTDSLAYRDFTATFGDALKRALFDRNTIERGDNEIIVEVVKLREGSVIVRYRIHWKPKPGMQVTEDLLTPETLKSNLDNYLARNNRMVSTFHVAEDKMTTSQVLDICKISKYDCQYECVFDERTLDFTCVCPPGHMLDMTNFKKCVPLLENSNEQNSRDITNETEAKKKFNTESVEVHNGSVFDWKETHHQIPETTTQPDTDVSFSHIFGNGNETPEPEPAAEPKPTEPAPVAESEPEPEPTSEPAPEPASEPAPEPNAQPEPASEPEPTSEPQAALEQSSKDTNLNVEPLSSEPAAEPQSTTEPAPEPEPSAEPAPEPQPAAEPAPEPEPTAEPVTEHSGPQPALVHAAEPASEPVAEPTAEPALKPTAEPAAKAADIPAAEPAPEPTAEPAVEPTAEPAIEPTAEPAVEPSSEPAVEPTDEPAVEPSDEHVAEPAVEAAAEPASEPAAEPAAEPKQSPISETTNNNSSELSSLAHEHSSESSKESPSEPQPPSEPTDSATSSETNQDTSSEQQLIPVLPAQSLETTTEPNTFPEMKSSNDGKEDEANMKESQSSDMNSSAETTTMRISISEPNLINEPSYEAKPEIVSILSETKPVFKDFTETEVTTNSEWLESEKTRNESDNRASIINGNNVFEQRSFNSYNNEFETETTTENDVNKKEADISFQDIHNNNELTSTSTILAEVVKKNQDATTMSSSNSSEPAHKEKVINYASKMNTSTVIEENKQNNNKTSETTMEEERHVVIPMKNYNSPITTIIFQSKKNKSNEHMSIETTTVPEETVTENDIQRYLSPEISNVTDMLLNALSNKKTVEVVYDTTTAKNIVDDLTDITFDNINNLNLYNRSSKSFEDDNSATIESSESTDMSNDSNHTTESEWLSVPVTEVNYNQVMNNMEKEETTQIPIAKIEEMINQGVIKDDFEPDYLNVMSSTSSKMTEADVPMYGITHDYDNEDSRFKRVDNSTSEVPANGLPVTTITEKMPMENSSMVNMPVETTTISQYIYDTAEKHNVNTSQGINEASTEGSNVKNMNINPAPVWEESEVDRGMKQEMFKEDDQMLNETTQTHTTSTRSTETPFTSTTTTEMPTTSTTTTEVPITSTTTTTTEAPKTSAPENNEGINVSSNDESVPSQNSTRLNNLGVTVYEVSSHSNLSATASNTTNSHSAEYEDHEVDMNPFLPEVENNKHLVKKLQEGHDLEPNNLNETQNENVEEHPVNALEGQVTSTNNNYTQIISTPTSVNVAGETTKLLPENDNTPSFLEDTDDLLQPVWESDEYKTSKSAVGPAARDSEYLSVVPIEQEKLELKALKKDYESRNLQGLNDISDSPKKSERTLDVTKLESVTNNEA